VGTEVVFAERCEDLLVEGAPEGELVIVDEAGKREGLEEFVERVGASRTILLLGNVERFIEVMRKAGCDHLIARDGRVEEEEIVVTTVKLLRGEVPGIEKYLTWGACIRRRDVRSYDEKRAALREVTDFARQVGCRRQVVSRIETVTDELLMNALYDAPASRYGCRPLYQGRGRPGAGPVTDEVAELAYGCDGRYFAVAVRDSFGGLRKNNILDNLERAREEGALPRVDSDDAGGGLGFFFVLSSVTRFVANIQPGKMTEVICLFDLRQGAREFQGQARSFSIFVVPEGGASQGPQATSADGTAQVS